MPGVNKFFCIIYASMSILPMILKGLSNYNEKRFITLMPERTWNAMLG